MGILARSLRFSNQLSFEESLIFILVNVEEGVWKKVLKGLERSGEGVQDEDLDSVDEEEEAEEEVEVQHEPGIGEVEYVSDDVVSESEEEEDLADLEDWLGDESQDEESAEESDEEDEGSEGSGEGEKDDEKLKKALGGLKRKRPIVPPKPSKKSSKGPKREIEYELEKEPPLRELVTA